MTYTLRNPLLIAKHAHKISQDAAENKVDICLKNDINTTVDTTIVDGSVVELKGFLTWQYALKAALEIIPFKRFAMAHIEASGDQITEESVCSIHKELRRPRPDVVTKPHDYPKYQNWVCNPKDRKSDICIVGVGHRSNGIQTSIVICILPQHCPECGYSSEDPVIASRATAMLITAMYQRLSCPNCKQEFNHH